MVTYLQRMPKRYRGIFKLDCHSASLDIESTIELLSTPVKPLLDELQEAAIRLTGPIMQRPPIYSALKVRGKRAYERARAGEQFEMPERAAMIYSLDICDYTYPHLTLEITCGSGTYIRTLGDDLARLVGSRAIMTDLERTAIGGFESSNAVDVCNLDDRQINALLQPSALAATELPKLYVDEAQLTEIEFGRYINGDTSNEETAAIDSQGRLRGILIPRGDGKLGPRRMFPRD